MDNHEETRRKLRLYLRPTENDDVLSKRVITPEIAERLLSLPVKQRKFERDNPYVRLMKEGMWDNNAHNVIKLTRDLGVGDGQHRLAAVIASGRPLDTYVAFNVSDEELDVATDNGRRRTSSHMLQRYDFKNTAKVVSICTILRRVEMIRDGLISNLNVKITNAEILDVLARWSEDVIDEGVQYGRNSRAYGLPSYAVSNAFFLIGQYKSNNVVSFEECDNFFSKVVTGEGLYRGDPRHTLRTRLLQMKVSSVGSGQAFQRYQFMCWVKAWNAYHKKNELFIIRVGKDESMPAIHECAFFPSGW